ncbi:MAG: NAD-dependent epimerase/dehydratase family protein [Cetobacterium sp.]
MKKTLMITGASGFIGSNFIKRYAEDYNIIPVDLLKVKPEELDYTGVDAILHLAALVHQMKGAPEEKYYEVNTELTRRVAESAKKGGVKHFVFYSTVAVYGTHGYFDHDRVITAEDPVNPKEPYGDSKWKAEEILRGMKDESFKVSILRPPMVYGENCPGNMTRLEKLVNILPILPFNYPENRRTIVHVDRLLQITDRVIKNMEEGIIIPKDEKDVSIKEIVESFGKKRVLVRFPKPVFNLMVKIKPRIMASLYGSLRFGGGKN